MTENIAPKLLIVHHSMEYAEDLGVFFEGQGYQTSLANTVRETADILASFEFDVVLLSLLLPDGNGLEFCRDIKKDKKNANTKVIIISSIPQKGRFGMEARTKYFADNYIEEPVAVPDLVAIVDKVVGLDEQGALEARDKAGVGASHAFRPSQDSASFKKVAATELDSATEEDFFPDLDEMEDEESATPPVRKKEWTLPLEGKLRNVLFPEMLLYLYQMRATGTLHLHYINEERTVVFRDGTPDSIRTTFILDESLGQLLVRQNLLDEPRLGQLLTQAKQVGGRLGDALVANGVLSPTKLRNVLKRQALFKLVNTFRLIDGDYKFSAAIAPDEVSTRIESDVLRILNTGISRHMDMTTLEDRVFGNRTRIPKYNRIERIGAAELGLSRKQWALIGLADGERNLGQILADTQLNFRQSFQTVYLFFLLGLFSFQDDQDGFFHVEEPVLSRMITESRSRLAMETSDFDQAEEMPTSGDVADNSLTKIFFRINLEKETGVLTVEFNGTAERTVIREGQPVKIETIGPGNQMLGELLVKRGLLSPQDRDEAVQETKQFDRPLGEILIIKGKISPHEIFETLKTQIEQKMQSLFRLKSGSYSFTRLDPTKLTSEMTFDVNVASISVESQKILFEDSELEDDLRKFHSFILGRTAIGKGQLTSLFVDAREAQVARLINGRRSLSQIVDRSPLPTTRVLRVVFALLRLGLVNFLQE